MKRMCQCGCGCRAPIAKRSDKRDGSIKGQPRKFIQGHQHWKHRMTSSREYWVYVAARERCTKPNHPNWKYYGGRGIKFKFSTFEEFIAAVVLKPSPELTLDRINNDGHYERGNLRWATRKEQAQNRRRKGTA
jgi:hypothetical protein